MSFHTIRYPFLRSATATCLALLSASPLLSSSAQEDQIRGDLSLLQAIQQTLERDPAIKIAQSRIDGAVGSAMLASSAFEPALTSSLELVDSQTPTSETTHTDQRTITETVAWTRLLRTGQTLTPSVTLEQEEGTPGASTGTVAFTFRQPLLRGREASANTVDERAAYQELDAGRLDLVFQISRKVAEVTNAYWAARAAMLDLQILQETEQRSRELLDTTRRLVDADITPAADLIQLEADLIFRESNRIASEQTLYARLQSLGQAIGWSADEIATIGLPNDPFPRIEVEEIPSSAQGYLQDSLRLRADLLAAQERLTAAEIRLEGAEDDLKSRLDLVLTPSYTGFVEGDGFGDIPASLTDNVPGLSATIGLSYTLPLGNRRAEASHILSSAAAGQQALTVDSNRIQIGAAVPTALEAVRSNADRSQKLERAVELFKKTLSNEEKKLRVGSSTLIDVLNQRDRLTTAQQRLVSAQLALAQALIDLRFETGTLVRQATEGVQDIRLDDLTTLPQDP